MRVILSALFALAIVGSAHAAADCTTEMGNIDGQSKSEIATDCNIQLNGKIDGQSEPKLTSKKGWIHIRDKIDGQSKPVLNAADEITVGDKIDGQSTVTYCSASFPAPKGGINGQSRLIKSCP